MKYFLGVLGVLLLIIFIIILALRGGDGNVPGKEVKKLSEYAIEADTEAVYTVSGAINAEENHRAVRITVTDSIRTIEVLDGYNGRVQSDETYPNTTDAFEAFLAGIEQVGFSKTRKTRLSYESICPTGRRYSFALNSGEEKVVDSWAATCEKGTYGGKRSITENLFQAQIPNYSKFTKDLSFAL